MQGKRNRKVGEIKTCLCCKKEFKSSNEKYCSRQCLKEDHKDVRACPTCGKYFNKMPSLNKTYCSSECRPKKQEKECPVCKTTFKTMIGKWERKTCSTKCMGITRRKGRYPDYDGMPCHIGRGGSVYTYHNGKHTALARYVVEKITGIKLSPKNHVHHIDCDKLNNSPSNLLVLQNNTEHKKIHARKTIQDAGGDWRTDKYCSKCNSAKRSEEFDKETSVCRKCRREYYQKRITRCPTIAIYV